MTASTLTVITPVSPNTAFALGPFSMREGTIALEPFSGADGDDAFGNTVQMSANGKLLDFSRPQFRLYQALLSCTDVNAPELDQGWRGALVQIDFPTELSAPVGSITLNGSVTAGGSSITVSAATGISAGQYIWLTGGTAEQVQVSLSYTAGSTTVGLIGTLAQNHSGGTPVVPVGRKAVSGSTPRIESSVLFYRPSLLMRITLVKNSQAEFPHLYTWQLKAIETVSA